MNLVPMAIRQKVARGALEARSSAPKVLFATGVAGMIGSTVLACRATLKMEEVIQTAQHDRTKAKFCKMMSEGFVGPEMEKIVENDPKLGNIFVEQGAYSENDYRRDMVVLYSRAFQSTLKLYAPAILLGSAAIGCLVKSHDILTKRNAAITAAYVAVDEAFTQYRQRVVEKYGEEQDLEFRYGVEEVRVTDENGKLYTEKRPEENPSMYARFFDEYSTNWSKEPEYNYVFLHAQQRWFNDMLKARGHVFLNEVYDGLGLPRTKAGSVVGWVVSHNGDNYVDFGIFKDPYNNNSVRDFINGRNGSILLDFNVDGIIYDKLDPNKERFKWQS